MDVNDIVELESFRELLAEVRAELERTLQPDGDRHSALEAERRRLEESLAGWRQSLGNPKLDPSLRADIEANYKQAKERIEAIDSDLVSADVAPRMIEEIASPEAVAERLLRLDEVLAGHNLSRCNLELALHIDEIECFPDRRVRMRICRLGALAGSVEILADPTVTRPEKDVMPRRRARLRIDESGDDSGLRELLDWAVDPQRFEGLDEKWFHVDETVLVHYAGWFDRPENMEQVVAARQEGLSLEETAMRVGVTVPTARKALNKAIELDPSLAHLKEKRPRARWHEDRAPAVAEEFLRRRGESGKAPTLKELAQHFGKSEPTIKKAIVFATEHGLLEQP